jgi:hypothetical protein
MDKSQTPQIAIGNWGDTNQYLINKKGKDTIVNLSSYPLETFFTGWETFVRGKQNPFLYIKEYIYSWKDIDTILINKETLSIENIAHTVSPVDSLYEFPIHSAGYEGYIAFDILLTGIGSTISDDNSMNPLIYSKNSPTSRFIDFAVPCPKNCYMYKR